MKNIKVLVLGAVGFSLAMAASLSTAAVVGVPDISTAMPAMGCLGLLVNKESISSVFASLKAIYQKAFEAAPSNWQRIAMKVPSTTGQNDYAWLSNFPRMIKWIGEKVAKSLEASKYVIVNDDFEATVEVDRNHIKDDQLGIYAPQAQMAGDSAKQLPDEIVFELVNRAFTNKCFDGQFFIDVDHPVGDGKGNVLSVSNKGTAVLSASTLANARAGYGAARTAMRKFKDSEGRPLNIRPDVLLVPPALEDEANLLMTVDKLEDGKPNPYKGTAEVVVDGRLESDTAWFLLDTTKPIKPFVYQERQAPEFVSQTDMQADDVFNRRKYKFGAEARAAGGYGFWQMAYGSTGQGA